MKKEVASYTTDNRVIHRSLEDDINIKLGKIIGKKFIEYRKKWDAVNRLEIITDFPMFLHLDLAQTCNYACPHCNISHPKSLLDSYNGKISESVNFKKYKKIVDEGAEYNCPSIEPQGLNEPLLDRNFHEYVKYAHKKNFIDIMINTNASALTPKRSQELLDSGLTRLRFSLDAATPETYKNTRIGSLPLEKIIKKIENFLELKEKGNYKLPVTGTSMLLMKGNQHEKKMFEDFWIDKVDMVTFQEFQAPNKEVDFTDFYPEVNNNITRNDTKKQFKCPQPYQRIVVRNDLIYPCCYAYGDNLVIGKLKDGIYNAWNSELARELRGIHKTGRYYLNSTCKKCIDDQINGA
jgi:MoaA/NifB/PqqE/SkfB family radical SAM enzyme